jgi:hypothetical protein
LFLHVPFHWWMPTGAEGFSDEVLQVAAAPKNPGDILALKTMVADRNELDPKFVTLFAWTILGD